MESICQQCGVTFNVPQAWVKRGGGRFCSSACYGLYQQAHPHTQRGKVAHPTVERTCKQCGKTFRADYRRREREYCSTACFVNAHRVDKICPVCGKSFRPKLSNANQIHCSAACIGRAERVNVYEPRPCARCGKIFRKPPNRHYCSEECRRPTHTFTCIECGKVVRKQPSEVSRRRFCSTRCYRRHTGETEPERGARLCLETLGIEYRQEYAVSGWRYPVDFYLPGLNTMLEIDSVYWHTRTAARDARKTLYLQSKGYRVVRLPDTPFYGALMPAMIEYLRAALALADNAAAQSELAGLYPIQLSLPLEEERVL